MKWTAVSRTALCMFMAPVSYAAAQIAPDAGRVLQEQSLPTLTLPGEGQQIELDMERSDPVAPGGRTMVISSVELIGNTIFASDTLLIALGDYAGKSYDLSGIRNLADKISMYYRQSGYPFVKVVVPEQVVEDGRLTLQVVEGRYGSIQAEGEEWVARGATKFLKRLKTGDPIENGNLERVALLLDDQPGMKIRPIVRPGQELGAGDLTVRVARERTFSGTVTADNFGNRYTGQYRGSADLRVDSPFSFGDQILFRALLTDETQWLGSLSYNRPLGGYGLRGVVSYSHTYYQLGKTFSNLDSYGTADTVSTGLAYSLVRSQRANLTLSAQYQRKWLDDRQGVFGIKGSKSSDGVPVQLNFDWRDDVVGSAISYGLVSWTNGYLKLDSGLEAVDSVTTRTAGRFSKINLDFARLQRLPENFYFWGRFSGQWTSENLDSSEGFGLGGPQGVRAYPTGEGYGDRGWQVQTELRYPISPFTPYVFFDAGDIDIDANQFFPGNNERSIAGGGLGVRVDYQGWNLDTSFAWRTKGGAPESDSKDSQPQIWVSLSRSF